MKPGSVVIDLAGEAGGNCELSEAGETIVREDVTIAAPLNLPSTMPDHASQLYARNIQALLELISEDGTLKIDPEDEIVKGALVTSAGHPAPRPDDKPTTSGLQ
jgi:H+-translocating NAD(P) transhydrogenase subunit alpha